MADRSRSRTPPPRASAPLSVDKPLEGLTALVLGLERRPDRRKRCEEMLAKEVPWLKFEFFRATDGKCDDIPESEVAHTWNTKNNSRYSDYEDVLDKDGNVIHHAAEFADPGVEYKFSPGERGCAHSHLRLWQHVAESNRPTLILEDDVELAFERLGDCGMASGKTFTSRFELGMREAIKIGAEVLYLGWSGFREGFYRHLEEPEGEQNPFIRKVEYVWTTVAYVLWPEGARKLLERAEPIDQPVDNFMAWEAREGRLASYVLLDEGDSDEDWAGGIVAQVDFQGDSDIAKSDGGVQGDDPTAFFAATTAGA